MMNDWQERTRLLLGENYDKLSNSNILICGLGGVGGVAAEMILRAGVTRMTIIDYDRIDATNRNRQIIATSLNTGHSKVQETAQRLRSINPQIQLNAMEVFLRDEKTVEILQGEKYDYVIDAIDSLSPKVHLIQHCLELNIPIVSSMGAGGRTDPRPIQVADIEKSYNCTLARILRKRLHRLGIRGGFKVVFSSEKADKNALQEVNEENKKTTLGTISYLPAIFGIYCAWTVINDIIERDV